jgi:hypothetical protein
MNTREYKAIRRLHSISAWVVLAFCITAEAKQPSPEEIGPPIFACEVREQNGRRFITFPAWLKVNVINPKYSTRASEVERKYVFPGGWEFYYAGDHGIDPPPSYFYRGEERITVEEMLRIGGLPW